MVVISHSVAFWSFKTGPHWDIEVKVTCIVHTLSYTPMLSACLTKFAVYDCENEENKDGNDGDSDYPIRSHPGPS